MIIRAIGRYRALEDITTRGSFSVGTIPIGTEFVVTQLNTLHTKCISPEFFGWMSCDLPVEAATPPAQPAHSGQPGAAAGAEEA